MNLLYRSFMFYIFLLSTCQSCFGFCSTTFRSLVHCLDKWKCSPNKGNSNWKGKRYEREGYCRDIFQIFAKTNPYNHGKIGKEITTLCFPPLVSASLPFPKLLPLMSIQTTYSNSFLATMKLYAN